MPHHPWHPKASHVMKYPLAENHEDPPKKRREFI